MTDPIHSLNRFSSGDELAEKLAIEIAAKLEGAVQTSGKATIAVSGGSTPKRLFQVLSKFDIDWSNITVTLIDERCVPDTSERSNAKLVQDTLLQNKAATATLIPLFLNGQPEDNVSVATQNLTQAGNMDVAVLGMGTDGHTASFFPKAKGLDIATDLNSADLVAITQSAASVEPRLTLTLPYILRTKHLFLHIEGNEKKGVLEAALKDGPQTELPIRFVLANKPDLQTYWAP